jgi:molybdenum cofactor cytidylyltransferase
MSANSNPLNCQRLMQRPSKRPIGLIILAAGASIRMGSPKQLLRLNGVSLLRRATLTALASVCQPIMVVLGAHAAVIRPEITDLPVHLVENADWQQGMGSSIGTGMRQLMRVQPESQAVLLMLCDQPLIDTAFINRLIDCYQLSPGPVVASEYNHQLGVPALFSREVFSELALLNGAAGAKKIIEKYASVCQRVPFPEGELDLDTPEDYLRMQARIEASDAG